MTPLEELKTIQQILNGNSDLFELLVKEHQKTVYNVALKMTGNESDALDASQEVFLKAYTNLAKFRGDCRFSVWLYRMTYNLCIDMARKKQRRPASSLTVADSEDQEVTELEIPDARYTPEAQLEKAELRRAVRSALDQLSEEHRNILVMREFSDLSYDEIADTLNLTAGTVKSRLARARKKLAKILIENGTFVPESRHTTGKEG